MLMAESEYKCVYAHSKAISTYMQNSFIEKIRQLFINFYLLLRGYFWDRFLLGSHACPGRHYVYQAGLELKISLASASWMLGLKVCNITLSYNNFGQKKQVYFILSNSYKIQNRQKKWSI